MLLRFDTKGSVVPAFAEQVRDNLFENSNTDIVIVNAASTKLRSYVNVVLHYGNVNKAYHFLIVKNLVLLAAE